MKQVFTLFCFAAASTVAMAQNLLIYTDGSKVPQTIALNKIDSIVVQQQSGHPEMTELVDIQVKNMGRFSFDVEIMKGDACTRYVAGAIMSPVYNEDAFVEQAIQSLDESAFFRPFTDAIGTTDMVFAERQLGINVLSNWDADLKEALYTTIAVYAECVDGTYKVYTKEILLPDAVQGTTPTATIEATNITSDNFTVTFTASDDCKKLIYGVTSPSALNGSAMSAEMMVSKKVSQGLPVPYTGTITLDVKSQQMLEPGAIYYPYVIPIAEDGKLGKVSYITVTTKAITSDGLGKILSASGKLQVEGQYRTVACPTMTFNDEAQKVRILWCNEKDFKDNYKGHLTEVFGKEANRDRAWSEYDVNALPRALNIYHYGDAHYMYAATVDKNGNVSEAQDVLALLGVPSPYTTNSASSYVPSIDFDGVATVNIENDYIEKRYGQFEYNKDKVIEANPYFTLKAGQNLDRVLVMRIDMDVTVKQGVESVLVGYPNYYVGYGGVESELINNNGTWTIEPANALGTNYTNENGTLRFKEEWLIGEKLVFVTVDTNGRPKIECVYTPTADGGTFAPYK